MASSTSTSIGPFTIAADKQLEQLSKLIEALSTCGQRELNPLKLQEFKELCQRGGDSLVQSAFHALKLQLRKQHSQVRLSCVQMIDQLFTRSHRFRSLLCTQPELNEFLELTIGLNDKQLPPPKQFNRWLQEQTVCFLQQWINRFGKGYPILLSSQRLLSSMNLQQFERSSVDDGQHRSQAQVRITGNHRDMVRQAVQQDVDQLQQRTDFDLDRMHQLFRKICPTHVTSSPTFADLQPDQCDNEDTADRFKRHRILASSVEITLKPYLEIENNDQNRQCMQQMKELQQQLSTVHLPDVKQKLKQFARDAIVYETQIRQCMQLKSQILNAIQAYSELRLIDLQSASIITCPGPSCTNKVANRLSAINQAELADDSSSDDDFIEVEGLPTESTFGAEAGILLLEEEHAPEALQAAEKIQASSNFNISISDETSCRVKMSNGKLCPRKDKHKCPFHGIIIPRDEDGLPIEAKARAQEIEAKAAKASDWQDPEFLADLQAETGIDLRVKASASRKGQRRYPNLIDIKKSSKTPRMRLKKILNLK